MTPQNESQMNESAIADEFEKWDLIVEYDFDLSKNESGNYESNETDGLFKGFKSAYSLQQSKISELQEEIDKQQVRISEQQMRINEQQVRINELENTLIDILKFKGPEYIKIINGIQESIFSLAKKALTEERVQSFHAGYIANSEKINNLKNENASLRSDLDWATNLISLGSLEYSNHNDCHNREIRTKHKLDAHDEQGVEE